MEEKLIVMCFCVSITCATAVFLKPVVKISEDKQEIKVKGKSDSEKIMESKWYKHVSGQDY